MKKSKQKTKYPSTIEEDLKSINEEELLGEKKGLKPQIKKALILLSAVFIALLFLSFIYIQYPLFSIIEGRIESQSPDNNVLQLKDFQVHFTDEAMNSLQALFSINAEVETSRCMKGTFVSGDYFIDEIYEPAIYSQSFRHVTSEPCSEDTLIIFHTHPYKSCIASTTDLNTLKSNQERNPAVIMLIMCEPNRFSTYR